MDEILLKADKARVVCDRAQEAWDKNGREGNLEDAINRALCRAQLQKAVENLDGWSVDYYDGAWEAGEKELCAVEELIGCTLRFHSRWNQMGKLVRAVIALRAAAEEARG